MIGYYPINPNGHSQEDAFGPVFFRSQFMDRIKTCYNADAETPILELMLTNGQVLDVACVIELKPDYVVIDAYIDEHDPERTYRTFIRYQTIYRINVQKRAKDDRAMGFNIRYETEDNSDAVLAKKKNADKSS